MKSPQWVHVGRQCLHLASLEVLLYVFLCQNWGGTSAFFSCPSEVSSFNTKMESKSTAALKQIESFTDLSQAE